MSDVSAYPSSSASNGSGTGTYNASAGAFAGIDFSNPSLALAVLQNQLASVRLGVASSLFQMLKVRHRPSADHSLRVAICCSSWSLTTEIDEDHRDEIEVAALLHDIGKVGTPDSILKNPNSLTDEQAAVMAESRQDALTILSACCESKDILKVIAYVGAWYDGSRGKLQLKGDQLPIGSRMIAIADAFDSMTHDRVYRRALPDERAIAELYAFAGKQFDPVLVDHFATLHSAGKLQFDESTARRWLEQLSRPESSKRWQLSRPQPPPAPPAADPTPSTPEMESQPEPQEEEFIPTLANKVDNLFHDKLLDCVPDGILYTDSDLIVTAWNRAAEQLTDISAESLLDQQWSFKLLKMRDDEGRFIHSNNCPFTEAMETGRKVQVAVSISTAKGQARQIDLSVEPIADDQGVLHGLTAVFRDATPTATLEERVESLHRKAICDPLTGLANRAEFDRFYAESIERHVKKNTTCSLIICDIDHFKSVNDQFGHQTGDEALVNFASVLQRSCREGDLVARYGGEEFVMVCENCTAVNATQIAESIRVSIADMPLRELGGRSLTASFGVTELQDGDTSETMLRRADRGLLQAKDTGRNRVVQLGAGKENDKPEKKNGRAGWFSWSKSTEDPKLLLECKLCNNVPLPLVAQKLRGFIADHNAEIEKITKEQVLLGVTTECLVPNRRKSDRPIPFRLQLDFMEEDSSEIAGKRTVIDVKLKTIKSRDRRDGTTDAGKKLIKSLQAYLMAVNYCPAVEPSEKDDD